MGRLPGFDYRRPFFYMVTLKKLPGIGEFSRIVSTEEAPADGRYLEATPIHTAGRTWHAYGNTELLDLPVLEPFRCSRKWTENGPEWSEALGRAERTGPGGAGVGTFMSACEKACGNAIFRAGGSLVVLSPEGFPPRWHPPRNKEALCAEGRMLFLSLYEPQAGRLDNATLYRRCHEMGDLIGPEGTGPAALAGAPDGNGPEGTGPATLARVPGLTRLEEEKGQGI